MSTTKPYIIIILLVALGLTACKNGTQKVEPQQEVPDSATVVMPERSITDRLYAELDSADVYDDAVIQGYWFKPHEACYVNVFFHKDNTFEYKFYTVDKDDEITDQFKKGTYTINGDKIHLVADDGWDEKVFDGIMYHKNNGTNYYLTDKDGDLYLVKGSD